MFETPTITDGWIEVAKSAITVGGTIIVAWFGHRVWKQRKKDEAENCEKELTDSQIDCYPIQDVLARILALEKVIEELAEDLDTRRQVLIAVLNAMELACWQSDENGKCVFASNKLSEVIGLPANQILGDGWVTNLIESDKPRVFAEWESSVKQKRMFVMKYAFIHDNDVIVNVRAVSSPIIVKGKLQGFIGILEEVK